MTSAPRSPRSIVQYGPARTAEKSAELRPVESATSGHEHEDIVVLATTDDDRPQEGAELDALELCALLGIAGGLRPNDAVRHGHLSERPGGWCFDRLSRSAHR